MLQSFSALQTQVGFNTIPHLTSIPNVSVLPGTYPLSFALLFIILALLLPFALIPLQKFSANNANILLWYLVFLQNSVMNISIFQKLKKLYIRLSVQQKSISFDLFLLSQAGSI